MPETQAKATPQPDPDRVVFDERHEDDDPLIALYEQEKAAYETAYPGRSYDNDVAEAAKLKGSVADPRFKTGAPTVAAYCGHAGCGDLIAVPMNGGGGRCYTHRDEAFDHNARSR